MKSNEQLRKSTGDRLNAAGDASELTLRRERREARRIKQRGLNILRAEKMHAMRLEFEARNAKSAGKRKQTSANFVGCSGWFYWHWRGNFYPEDAATKDWFPHYASQFLTVELNAPFYAWPTAGTVQTWIKQAGRRKFIYTVKVCELITHIRRMVRVKTLVQDFGLIADLLGPRFGCFLFQFPPSYRYTPSRLKTITASLDHTRRNVVEFRHRSWWNQTAYEAFRANGTIFCSTSGPRLPDELIKTSEDVYIRFHGTKQWYRHDYSNDELDAWVERIRTSGAKRVWAYFNNDRDAHAIKNAKSLIRKLKSRTQSLKSKNAGRLKKPARASQV